MICWLWHRLVDAVAPTQAELDKIIADSFDFLAQFE